MRRVLFLLGVVAIVLLVSRLPADVFATTRAILLVAAGVLLLALALGVFLRPARRALGRFFTFHVPEGPAFSLATEPEWRDLVRALLAALVLVAVAGLPALLRPS